jgi:CRP-like cAMP-binding protein
MADAHKPARFVDLTERAIYLRSIPVAAELPPRVLHVIALALEERELSDGSPVMRAGEPVESLHLLTHGEIALRKGQVEVGRLKPPQSLGFLDILARSEGSYDAIAVGDVCSLELAADALFEIMEDHFSLLVATLRYAAERMLAEMQELPAQALGIPPETMPIAIPSRELDLVERVLILRNMAVFRRTNVNALSVLSEHMPEVRVPAGAALFDIGERPTFTVFVVQGAVRCTTEDGRSFIYGPGTAVGGVESLAGKSRWYRAVAETDLVFLRGSADALLDMMEDNADLGRDFIAMLAMGLKAMIGRKLAAGAGAFETKRDVSGLGAVPVGA